jgi:hypothetical protein
LEKSLVYCADVIVMRGKLGKLTSSKNPVIFKISDRTKVANWFLDAQQYCGNEIAGVGGCSFQLFLNQT